MTEEPDETGSESIEALRREAAARRRDGREAQTLKETFRTRPDPLQAIRPTGAKWPEPAIATRQNHSAFADAARCRNGRIG